MSKILFAKSALLTGVMLVLGLASCSDKEDEPKIDASRDMVNILDYVKGTNTQQDVSAQIQKAIDENPNRVIYFPDGKYLIGKPIVTPADPKNSVSLELSNYAIIKAIKTWNHDEAMIRLGGKEPSNSNTAVGSNYYLKGGIIDCNQVAKGIAIESGRETTIHDTSIKNAVVGIEVKGGSNNGSSDADIYNVNITGNGTAASIGVLVYGLDNTFTNMRISDVQYGFKIHSGSNYLTNIHPLYVFWDNEDTSYNESIGFYDLGMNNFYTSCYSDQFATGFYNTGSRSVYNNCYCYWYSNVGAKHVAFKSQAAFNSVVTNFTMGLTKDNAAAQNYVLEEMNGAGRGKGVFENVYIDSPAYLTNRSYETYLK